MNCHVWEMAPLQTAGIEVLVDSLLVGCSTKEDALAASFCLLRCMAPVKPAPYKFILDNPRFLISVEGCGWR